MFKKKYIQKHALLLAKGNQVNISEPQQGDCPRKGPIGSLFWGSQCFMPLIIYYDFKPTP